MFPAVVVLADYAGALDLSNRTEVRGRHTEGTSPDPSLDVVDTPAARIAFGDRQWDYALGYAALVMLPDTQDGLAPQVLSLGDAGIAWHDRRVRIGLTENATHGEQNSAYLLQQPAAPAAAATPTSGTTAPQLLAEPATLKFGSSRTLLSTQLRLTRRWLGVGVVDYEIQGGLDAASRALLPIVRTARAEIGASFRATRRDDIETRAAALRSDAASCSPAVVGVAPGSTCSPAAETAQVTETWRRRLTRTTDTAAGVGASLVATRVAAADPFVNRLFPVLSAAIQYARPGRVPTLARLGAQVAPLLDLRSGIVDERAQGVLDITLPVRRITLTANIAATRSILSGYVQAATSVQGSVEVDYRIADFASLGGGARYAWQEQDVLGTFSGGYVFAAITLHAPRLRF